MSNHTTISIDLAKETFQVAVFNKAGKVQSNREVSAVRMINIIAQHPGAKIFMEACGSAHYWARRFTKQGHSVGLIPPHIAAKYRSGNKNDKNDAIAIYEASRCANLHCVEIRTLEQQDIAALHKHREGYKKERNKIANRIRGFAREYGVNFPLGINALRKHVPEALEDAENELTPVCREILNELLEQLIRAIDLVHVATQKIERLAKTIEPCTRLVAMPGISWLSASMLYAKLGAGTAFKCGRDASASLGVVPAHSGSGGKVKIGRITKRGDTYLRSLLTNGARAVVVNIKEKTDGLSCWIRTLQTTKNFNITVIAVVNKLVRMALAILKSGQRYRTPVAQVA